MKFVMVVCVRARLPASRYRSLTKNKIVRPRSELDSADSSATGSKRFLPRNARNASTSLLPPVKTLLKNEIGCGCPSTSSSNSSGFNPLTNFPSLSKTITSVCTNSVLMRTTSSISAAGVGVGLGFFFSCAFAAREVKHSTAIMSGRVRLHITVHRLPVHRKQNNLGRYAEANGHDARTNACRHKQVVIVFEHVPRIIPVAKFRRLDDRSDQRKPDLPTVSVGCQQ